MAVSQQNSSSNPTPDYGSLGPDSDVLTNKPLASKRATWRPFFAVVVGALLGFSFVARGPVRNTLVDILTRQAKSVQTSNRSKSQASRVASRGMQKQAEVLLGRDVNHSPGAHEEIETRVEGWRGVLSLTPQLNSLITAALNSNDFEVRKDGIEVDLATMGLSKSPQSADQLIQQASGGPNSQRIWALWTMGLLANRGVETDRITGFLVEQRKNPDAELRQWAVEGLSYIGTDDTIAPLLQAFHDDPSSLVRERAGCSLAQSGMLTAEQRKSIVPRLLDFSEDASLDAQTRAWVYQALRDITSQSLPNTPAAWRSWYEASGNASSNVLTTAN